MTVLPWVDSIWSFFLVLPLRSLSLPLSVLSLFSVLSIICVWFSCFKSVSTAACFDSSSTSSSSSSPSPSSSTASSFFTLLQISGFSTSLSVILRVFTDEGRDFLELALLLIRCRLFMSPLLNFPEVCRNSQTAGL